MIRYYKVFLIAFVLFCCNLQAISKNAVEFSIVVPSYNNIRWVEQNLNSVISQKYDNWHLYYYDDASTDGTGSFVDTFIENNNLSDKCTVIHNSCRKGALANFYTAIHSLRPETVVVMLDGDDKLANRRVLLLLAQVYSDKNVWMTFGSFRKSEGVLNGDVFGTGGCCGTCPEWVMQSKYYRKFDWFASHLRTCYAKLFQQIQKEDLMSDGQFFNAAWDLALMFPMLEMSSNNHFRHIPEILYIYNEYNPISDTYINRGDVLRNEAYIRNLPVYPTLETLF